MKAEQTIVISAAPDKVWALIDDPDRVRQWLPQIVETKMLGDAKSRAVGTRFSQKFKQGGTVREYSGEIKVYQPGRQLGVQVNDASFGGTISYTLTSAPSGLTEVRMAADITPKNMLVRAASTVSGPILGMALQKLLGRLKAAAERPA